MFVHAEFVCPLLFYGVRWRGFFACKALSAVSWAKIGIFCGGFPGFVCILVNSYWHMWVCIKNNVTLRMESTEEDKEYQDKQLSKGILKHDAVDDRQHCP